MTWAELSRRHSKLFQNNFLRLIALLLQQVKMPSRWADSAEDAAEEARRKAEKEVKKRLKVEKQRKAEEASKTAAAQTYGHRDEEEVADRPAKRRRLSQDDTTDDRAETAAERALLRFQTPGWQPCRSVERFTRLNHIEEGSYGFVSRAKEEATGEIVAIKKLKLNPAVDGGFPVTALREIQCLNAAKHRHIVHLREIVTGEGSAKEDVYLVMEFLEHDLKTLQDDMEEPFMPSEVKTLLLQLGSAVEFLHDHWILHRDLKTSNILMNNRGEIKIADFGMARFCGDPPPPNLTQLVVTLWYRAPELLLGTTSYDSLIDMWSLGCIFGELLTKQPLLQGKNEVDELSKVSQASSPPTRGWKEQIPKVVYSLVNEAARSSNSAASPPKKPGRDSNGCPTRARYAFPPTPTPTQRQLQAASSAPNSPPSQMPAQPSSIPCCLSIQLPGPARRRCWSMSISGRIRGRNRRRCFRLFRVRLGRRNGEGRLRQMRLCVVRRRGWGRWIIVPSLRGREGEERGGGFHLKLV